MTERERMVREVIVPDADGLRITTDAKGRAVYSVPRKKSERHDGAATAEVTGAAAE